MLNALFHRSHHVHRLRANPLGAILDQFTDYLLRPGYTVGFVHQLMRTGGTLRPLVGHAAPRRDRRPGLQNVGSPVSPRASRELLVHGSLPAEPQPLPCSSPPSAADARSA